MSAACPGLGIGTVSRVPRASCGTCDPDRSAAGTRSDGAVRPVAPVSGWRIVSTVVRNALTDASIAFDWNCADDAGFDSRLASAALTSSASFLISPWIISTSASRGDKASDWLGGGCALPEVGVAAAAGSGGGVVRPDCPRAGWFEVCCGDDCAGAVVADESDGGVSKCGAATGAISGERPFQVTVSRKPESLVSDSSDPGSPAPLAPAPLAPAALAPAPLAPAPGAHVACSRVPSSNGRLAIGASRSRGEGCGR